MCHSASCRFSSRRRNPSSNLFDRSHVIWRGLASLASVEQVSDGVRVTTHCTYPSNGLVQVMVRGGVETVVASNEGGAFGEAAAAEIPIAEHHSKLLAGMVRVTLKDGVIFTPRLPIVAAPVGILHVANASQEVARWFYEHCKIKRARDFRVLLSEFCTSHSRIACVPRRSSAAATSRTSSPTFCIWKAARS